MGKNAYEIRLDALHLAFDILSRDHEAKLEKWRDSKDNIIQAAGVSVEGPSPDLPDSVKTENVLAEAEKLYAFIEKGKDEDRA